METADVPAWITTLGSLVSVVGASAVAVWAGRKTKTGVPGAQAEVVAGLFAPRDAITSIVELLRKVSVELQDSREQRHRDSLRECECMEALARATEDNTEARRSAMRGKA